MADMEDEEEITILACSTIMLSAAALTCNNVVKKKRRHSVWVRGFLKLEFKKYFPDPLLGWGAKP